MLASFLIDPREDILPLSLDNLKSTKICYKEGFGALYVVTERDLADSSQRPPVTPEMLSDDQKAAYSTMLTWAVDALAKKTQQSVMTLGGYAGTGKTTLTGLFSKQLPSSRVVYTTYTGKASGVLRRNLVASGVQSPAVKTLHKFLYKVVSDPKTGKPIGWELRPPEDFEDIDFIVVDEASMVPIDLWKHLRSLNIPILAVGDHGQLPPVDKSSVNIVADPMLRLDNIHRQAENSPIISFSARIRKGQHWKSFDAPHSVKILPPDFNIESFYSQLAKVSKTPDFVTLVAKNVTRHIVNARYRKVFGFTDGVNTKPSHGDPIVVLKNVDFNGVLVSNGMRGYWHGDSVENEFYYGGCVVFPDDDLAIVGRFIKSQFSFSPTLAYGGAFKEHSLPTPPGTWDKLGFLCDWGAALTVHKSQGSQWKGALVLEERTMDYGTQNHNRWLYTAVTRASTHLFVRPV
jgi:exodeoxyribonuclease-5